MISSAKNILYRKKQATLDRAVQWNGRNFDEVMNFLEEDLGHKKAYEDEEERATRTGILYVNIKPYDSFRECNVTDWIIISSESLEISVLTEADFRAQYVPATMQQELRDLKHLLEKYTFAEIMVVLFEPDENGKLKPWNLQEDDVFCLAGAGTNAEIIEAAQHYDFPQVTKAGLWDLEVLFQRHYEDDGEKWLSIEHVDATFLGDEGWMVDTHKEIQTEKQP